MIPGLENIIFKYLIFFSDIFNMQSKVLIVERKTLHYVNINSQRDSVNCLRMPCPNDAFYLEFVGLVGGSGEL